MKISLDKIKAASDIIYLNMSATPQYCWPLLCHRLGTEVWIKHENHTPIGAFKIRGGLFYFDSYRGSKLLRNGVITATRGNHGQSLGFAAKLHGIAATVIVPYGNSMEKNAAMRALGVVLIEHGEDFQSSREYAETLAQERGLHMMPSYHPLLVTGVATYSYELFGAISDIDIVYVPVGLGSGICGMVSVRDLLELKTRIVGVVSAHANAYAQSFHLGRSVESIAETKIADGIACRVPEPEALEVILKGVERIVTVTDDEIAFAMQMLFECTHNTCEGAGAAATAAAWKERAKLKGLRVAVVLSGGNVDRNLFASVLRSRNDGENFSDERVLKG